MNDAPIEPSPSRHSVTWWLVTIVALLLTVGIVVAIALALPRMKAARKARTAMLPGGARVELLGTTVGEKTFSTDKPWMARMRRILPAPLRRWLPAEFTGGSWSGSNCLTVWLGVSPAGAAPPVNWGGTVTEDDAGFVYAGGNSYGSFGTGGRMGLNFNAYPRRQKDFLLHLVDKQGVIVATLRVPNPDPGPLPTWQPLPLPQTLTNGPGTLTLSRLEERKSWNNTSYVGPTWKFESGQPGWSNATVRYWTVIDASGNDGPYLSPRESAWKLRAQVMRPNPEDFAPAEKLVLSNLPAQAAGQFIAIDQTNLAAGVTIGAAVLCGPGCLVITNGTARSMPPAEQGRTGHISYGRSSNGDPPVEEWGATNSFFLVDMAKVQVNDEIHFHLRDDHGRDVKIEVSGWTGSTNGGRIYQPTFTAPADARSVTLEVIVDRPLIFDFLVDPKDVQPAKR